MKLDLLYVTGKGTQGFHSTGSQLPTLLVIQTTLFKSLDTNMLCRGSTERQLSIYHDNINIQNSCNPIVQNTDANFCKNVCPWSLWAFICTLRAGLHIREDDPSKNTLPLNPITSRLPCAINIKHDSNSLLSNLLWRAAGLKKTSVVGVKGVLHFICINFTNNQQTRPKDMFLIKKNTVRSSYSYLYKICSFRK